jgi:hypothetical protein
MPHQHSSRASEHIKEVNQDSTFEAGFVLGCSVGRKQTLAQPTNGEDWDAGTAGRVM